MNAFGYKLIGVESNDKEYKASVTEEFELAHSAHDYLERDRLHFDWRA